MTKLSGNLPAPAAVFEVFRFETCGAHYQKCQRELLTIKPIYNHKEIGVTLFNHLRFSLRSTQNQMVKYVEISQVFFFACIVSKKKAKKLLSRGIYIWF